MSENKSGLFEIIHTVKLSKTKPIYSANKILGNNKNNEIIYYCELKRIPLDKINITAPD